MVQFMDPIEAEQLTERVIDDYGKYVNDGMARLYRFAGFNVVEWDNCGALVRDAKGNEYIDCGGYGVFIHGHRHPRVVNAVREQLDRLPLSNRTFPHKNVADLGRILASVTPGDLQYSFFCNSGTEAVEGAIKLARAYTGRTDFVSTYGAFHGKSMGSLSASGREFYRQPFYPLVPGFTHVPFNDIGALEQVINEETAAVILEPIQGEGGVQIPSDDYLPAVRELCSANGALLIMDEIQTGLGRTGKMFACEHWGVVPDILCMAKALGGGVMPIGAFTTTAEIFSPFNENPYLHSSTFGGNPLACSAAIAAIQAIQEEKLVEKAAEKGNYALVGLRKLKEQYPEVIADVRGKGLLIGVEFTTEGVGGFVLSDLIDRRVIVLHSLNQHQVIRFMPPAIISSEQLETALEAFGLAVAEAQKNIADL